MHTGKWQIIINHSIKSRVALDKKENPYVELAAAILKQAVDDYIFAIEHDEKRKQKKLEAFFMTDWGSLLSFDQGEYIILTARQLAEERKNKKHQHRDAMTQNE